MDNKKLCASAPLREKINVTDAYMPERKHQRLIKTKPYSMSMYERSIKILLKPQKHEFLKEGI